jgi:hypothetical protein
MAPFAKRSMGQQQQQPLQPVIVATTVGDGKHSVMDHVGLATVILRRNFYSDVCVAERRMNESNRKLNWRLRATFAASCNWHFAQPPNRTGAPVQREEYGG